MHLTAWGGKQLAEIHFVVRFGVGDPSGRGGEELRGGDVSVRCREDARLGVGRIYIVAGRQLLAGGGKGNLTIPIPAGRRGEGVTPPQEIGNIY